MKYGIRVGESLSDFSLEETDYRVKVRDFGPMLDPDKRGYKVEEFMEKVLNLFNINTISVTPGSKIDLWGIDFLLRSYNEPPLTLGVQVKTTLNGVNHFLHSGNLGDKIIITWVDLREIDGVNLQELKKNFLFTLIKTFKSLGIFLKNEFFLLLQKVNKLNRLQQKGVHFRNIFHLFSVEQVSLLKDLGLITYHQGLYFFK